MANLIGRRVGGWRKSRGLSQSALATRAGIPQAAVSSIELGRRDCSLRTVYRLALALDITPGTLLDADPPWSPLTRHEVDAVSRAIVSGRRDLPQAHRRLADACAGSVRPTLEACGAPGARRARLRGFRSLLAAEREFGLPTVKLVLGRIEKHIGGLPR